MLKDVSIHRPVLMGFDALNHIPYDAEKEVQYF